MKAGEKVQTPVLVNEHFVRKLFIDLETRHSDIGINDWQVTPTKNSFECKFSTSATSDNMLSITKKGKILGEIDRSEPFRGRIIEHFESELQA